MVNPRRTNGNLQHPVETGGVLPESRWQFHDSIEENSKSRAEPQAHVASLRHIWLHPRPSFHG